MGSGEECGRIKSALAKVREAANRFKKGSKRRAALEAILAFYGDFGVNNGVTVDFDNSLKYISGTVHEPDGSTVITFNLQRADERFGPGPGGSNLATEVAAATAHEGVHGLQFEATQWIWDEAMVNEIQAYTIMSYVNQGLGVNSAYGVWTIQKGFDPGRVDAYAVGSAEGWCAGRCK